MWVEKQFFPLGHLVLIICSGTRSILLKDATYGAGSDSQWE